MAEGWRLDGRSARAGRRYEVARSASVLAGIRTATSPCSPRTPAVEFIDVPHGKVRIAVTRDRCE